MGKYGVKIYNIQASTLYETNKGIRTHFEYKKAMITNSLFLDFLQKNDLNIYNKDNTKDIICLEFDWGTRSYEQELKHLRKLSRDARSNNNYNKRKQIIKIYQTAKKNKNLYVKLSKEQIRDYYYINGVDVTYKIKNKKNEIKKQETIHYKMLYRSNGKAKKGSCMFIKEKLYKQSYDFLTMGMKIDKKNAPIVEINGYIPLIASTIIDRIEINPKNILILKDVESFFKTKVTSVELNDNHQCVAKNIDNYMVKNVMFDGQALIEHNIFPENAEGCILLRQHFCKMECVDTHIQLFFKDYFKDNYDTAIIVDMFGNEHYAKDIELITTDNAMKWTKFNITYDYWCQKVNENNNTFGIVKTTHKSKLGDVQRMSYQMVNTLNNDIMENVTKKSMEYVIELKSNNNTFLDYLYKNKNFSNDYEVLIALVNQNEEFLNSIYFRDRKKEIIRCYVNNLKRGKLIQNADNLILIGSPYSMLLHSVGLSNSYDDTLKYEDGVIQCCSNRFADNEYLAGFRSPHNSLNNTIPLHNVYNSKIERYFNLGNLILAVNVNNTDIQDRANGCDFDSDSIYCTNQPDIVKHVLDCYKKYPTIVNNIPKEKNKYNNCLEHYADIDNSLAISSTIIGESSNLAQLALTYAHNFNNPKYQEYVCILSVLAQVAIDSAKRRFDINLDKEIKRIKKDIDIKNNGLPEFWGLIKNVNKKRINKKLKCPMNYLSNIKIPEFKSNSKILPMSYFFIKFELTENRRKCKKVENLIEKYSLELRSYNIDDENILDKTNDYLLLYTDFDKLISDISDIYISNNYLGLMSWLIDRVFEITPQTKGKSDKIYSKIGTNKSVLLKVLYDINPSGLLKCFSNNMPKMV